MFTSIRCAWNSHLWFQSLNFTFSCLLRAARMVVGSSPEPPIWGSRKVRKHAEGIHHGFETQGRHHQKSKTGVSVKPRADITRSPKQGYQRNPGQTSPEVQNRISVKPTADVTRRISISAPTKRTYVRQNFFKKIHIWNQQHFNRLTGTATCVSYLHLLNW